MSSLPLFALVLLTTASPASDEPPPKAVVVRFLERARERDWTAAAAMLTADAQVLVGHVGGPLNAETVSVIGAMDRANCKALEPAETKQRLDGHPDLRFVEVRHQCSYRDKPGTHEMVATIFVKKGQIAGYMLN
jgi:hypothetical protein